MSKEKKISLAIVFGVLALTVFFFFEALNLTINGDFTRFFPWDEIDDVYYVESIEREETKTKSAGIMMISSIPAIIRQGLMLLSTLYWLKRRKIIPIHPQCMYWSLSLIYGKGNILKLLKSVSMK